MEDKEIIALYWKRSEDAIQQTAAKYGGYCGSVIRRVLGDGRDAEECLSDTWLKAWNAIPPQRPDRLRIFLGRIARNTALDRYDYNTAQRRDGGFGGTGGLCERDAYGRSNGYPAVRRSYFRLLGKRVSSGTAGIPAAVLVL